ncbi:MAG: D-alanyl-D-alanine carboxypeptidase PBP6B, partial [Acinetobacter baumannii]|nr:D-alanyl-D-alanine carboxypeptidase PBP6B [Acinetobacter baumannii]
MKFFLSLFTLFSIFCTTLTNAALLNIAPESVEAAAWTIVDTQSGQIIAEHNSHVQRAPASLTKMMVAYIALKEIKAGKLKLNEVITATPVVSVVQWDESQMYLKAGEQISVDQLLAGLIVMSANDAAVTLAEKISGDVPHFVQRMNQEAQALGMKDTHFSNPAGITMPDHYTTA